MGKVILSIYVTLDGFISGPNGELDWLPESEDTSKDNIEMLENADGILFGREIYKVFEDYWPTALSNPDIYSPDIPLAQRLDALPKYVFSSKLEGVHWKNTSIIKNRAEEAVAHLKLGKAGDLVVYGGAVFARSLMKAGLIDEYQLSVAPLVLGRGKSLFKDLGYLSKLKLIATKVMEPGFVKLCYQPVIK